MIFNDNNLKAINNICKSFSLDEWEDLRQDLFVKILESDTYFNSDTHFLNWCAFVARNLCVDKCRRKVVTFELRDFNTESDEELSPLDMLNEIKEELSVEEVNFIDAYLDNDCKYIRLEGELFTNRQNASIELNKIIKKCKKFI